MYPLFWIPETYNGEDVLVGEYVPQVETRSLVVAAHLAEFVDDLVASLLRRRPSLAATVVQGIDLPVQYAELMHLPTGCVVAAKVDAEAVVRRWQGIDRVVPLLIEG